MTVVEARGLGKSFGGKRAVNDLSFTVQPGRVTGFLGPNGSGKSTTMRLMVGLDRGDGETTFGGQRFGDLQSPMTQVGTLLDARAFHPTRSARNHLRMLAKASGLPATRADEVLELVGLSDVARKGPRGFSLGMAQRLGIAAALVGDPHTLVLDEPSNGLDPQGITWLRGLLKHLAAEGRSIFVSSHLLQEMALLADELVVIGRGSLLATGPVSQFLEDSHLGAVTVRSPDQARLVELLQSHSEMTVAVRDDHLDVHGATSDQIGDLAFEHGIRIHQLAEKQATLEEAFLAATQESEEFRASQADS